MMLKTLGQVMPSRRCVVAKSMDKPIFESFPSRGPVSLQEAREIYEICKYVKDPKQRVECYAIWGLDGQNVEKYMSTVDCFEKSLQKTKEEEQMRRAYRFALFGWVIYLCRDV